MKPNYKPIVFNESNLVNVQYQENIKQFEYPWHCHEEYELTYIPTGRGLRYVGNSVESFYDHDLVLIGSNIPHCWVHENNSIINSANAIVIYFKLNFLDITWMQSNEFETIRNLLSLSNKGVKFNRSMALKVRDKCIKLTSLPPLEKLIKIIEILQELGQSSDYNFLCEEDFSFDFNNSNNQRINKVNEYISRNYTEKISLADVAEHVFMSREYFSRFFSKIMKKSFFEFLNEYRIAKACRLLIDTDENINEICYSVGFESVPFFYRQFKKFKSCQPKQYRLNHVSAFSKLHRNIA